MAGLKLYLLLALMMISCAKQSDVGAEETWRTEILNTEKAFAQMAKEKGLKAAFLTFADEDAVLKRGNQLIIGKSAISNYFDAHTQQDAQLEWEPDFIDVASSGDLGYTYGKYIYAVMDENGQTTESQGIFHTVWRKQADGKWRFVWD